MILPTLSLVLVTRASAQFAQRPAWAVLAFESDDAKGKAFGAVAADAITNELQKRQDAFRPPIEVVPGESVKRAQESLGLTDPITDPTSVLRLGQELRASRVVVGRIAAIRMSSSNGNKQASVALQISVRDVASGININGANVQAFSTVRPASTPDETVVNEAIAIAAGKGVGSIQAQALPTGTVLNTTPDRALVNQGSRSGFKVGQEVIVTRRGEQVATAKVVDVDFDSSTIQVLRSNKGLTPGDKVSVIFKPAEIVGLKPDGTQEIRKPRAKGDNSALISVVLLLGLALLIGSKDGGNQSAAVGLKAVPYVEGGAPAIKVTWSTNGFALGRYTRVVWQLWRSDDGYSVPISATTSANFVDRNVSVGSVAQSYTYDPTIIYYNGQCNGAPATGTAASRPVIPGVSYSYRVALLFRVNQLDLPDNNSGGGGTAGGTAGNTGGTNTGGNTGGTNTTGTNTSGNTGTSGECYFWSDFTFADGSATGLVPPVQQTPAAESTVSGNTLFTFISAFGANVNTNNITVEYVLQISTDATFSKSKTATLSSNVLQTAGTGTLSIGPINVDTIFPSASILYWRVGAKNVADVPGPDPDPRTGQRYIFSNGGTKIKRPVVPPPPP